jgi:asparagine synthase (glutamine-hydrolysing)
VAEDRGDQYLSLRSPVLTRDLRHRLVRDPLRRDDERARTFINEHAADLDGTTLDATLFLDAQLGLVDDMLHYSDRVSMAQSLEVRVPYLDHELVEFAATIPAGLKVRGRTTKHLLKRVAHGIIPEQIIEKPKTGFFNSAMDSWLRTQLTGRAADFLLSDDAAYDEFLDAQGVRRAISDGRAVPGESAYALLMLEVWLSTFLPRAAAVARSAPAVVSA